MPAVGRLRRFARPAGTIEVDILRPSRRWGPNRLRVVSNVVRRKRGPRPAKRTCPVNVQLTYSMPETAKCMASSAAW